MYIYICPAAAARSHQQGPNESHVRHLGWVRSDVKTQAITSYFESWNQRQVYEQWTGVCVFPDSWDRHSEADST